MPIVSVGLAPRMAACGACYDAGCGGVARLIPPPTLLKNPLGGLDYGRCPPVPPCLEYALCVSCPSTCPRVSPLWLLCPLCFRFCLRHALCRLTAMVQLHMSSINAARSQRLAQANSGRQTEFIAFGERGCSIVFLFNLRCDGLDVKGLWLVRSVVGEPTARGVLKTDEAGAKRT